MRLCGVALAVAVLAVALFPTPAGARARKLIEMGWDEPDPAFMRAHLEELESSPFDGCVFHVGGPAPDGRFGRVTWGSWGRQTFTEADLAADLSDLRATPFRRFRTNFLRLNVTPGDLDWFDDFSAILGNAELVASVARRGGTAGILLDTEPYDHPVFQYAAQRDTARRGFRGYAEQARRRGAEVMRAFERGFPGLTVFLTVAGTWPLIEWEGDRQPPRNSRYGLLTAFVDGMVEAASDSAHIVDGMEASYPARDSSALARYSRQATRDILPWVADSTRYRRVVSHALSLWLDYDSQHRPWDARDTTRNYRTPTSFERTVRSAIALADDYVWIYAERPRWWSTTGRSQDLPEEYVHALRAARGSLAP